ncbi:Bug family tripartite tricarboxylate transporter substrate binding protein [Rhodoplanes sp. Z2-YC6860]|uniref:Bug family tripartite tricarboxylate transporter substrate binding protein n=1 Tax=Rhodoplanes sp. Z2-YC6860 TaxID=674703 RepID=UPI00078CD371|nr:tripartite tricarboxylate transporter substrate-binding protein [Rhodoplanes sp. Z2-YC6860]AMN44356.1 tricarboxylate transport protein [Rhodoplanes sp. Z2-YC6860]
MTKFPAAILSAFLAVSAGAQAQDFPTRPVTMVVPYGAGSPADVIGRLLAQRMSEALGQQVVVENIAGAGGTVGVTRVAKAPPDGYMFVQGGTGTHAQSQTLYKNPPYDAANDFTPLALIAESPLVLEVRKDLPADDLKAFIAYAKTHPTTYGSAGVGSATHLSCALLTDAAGFNATHVPYRGMGPVMQDLTAGRIDFGCDFVLGALPQVEGKVLKALAVLTKERSAAMPDVPTASEQGLKDFEAYNWNAMFLPKGTPEPVVNKLHAALMTALDTPLVQERLLKLGAVIPKPGQRTPAYLREFVKSEIVKWAGPIKASGAAAE